VTACGGIEVEFSNILTRPSCPHSAARCRAVKRCYNTTATKTTSPHHQRQQTTKQL